MPNCIQLFRKGEKEAVSFHEVDKEICQLMNVPVSMDKWCCDWYNIIGFLIAVGKTLPEIAEMPLGVNSHQIAVFMAERYTSNAWYEPK
jgi:hypothetical protein